MHDQSVSSVVGLLHDLYSVSHAIGPSAVEGSPANVEIQSFPDAEASKMAFSQGVMLLESAADHLEALDTLVHGKKYAIAPWTCARAVLEASSLATWLLDTQIDAKERVGRSLSLRFEAFQEQEKLAKSKSENAPVKKIKDRIADVEKKAIRLGYPSLRDKKGKLIGIGKIKPSITTLIRSQFSHETLYRILSGMAHSNYVVLRQMAFGLLPPDKTGKVTAKRAIPEEMQLMMLANSAAVYARGAWLRTIQFGHDAAQVAIVLEKRYNELGLADTNEVRFWRTLIQVRDHRVPIYAIRRQLTGCLVAIHCIFSSTGTA